ncbi:MAG: protein-L-isoaspartate O-methyltransferase [Microvirga sp.]|nr:protein-L-isoaspartate O-methyltransferase [Microvirga sp.]
MRHHAGEGQLNFNIEAVEAAAFVLALRERGLRDAAVLGAMERVPRDLFAPRRFADLSRRDVALPLPLGQTMTAPGPVAVMLTALKMQPGASVLEIGTGSGYVSALLARLGGQVVTVERYAALADGAAMRFAELGLARSIDLTVRDGLDLQTSERFARILLNGALPAIPETVSALLAPGGRLVGAVTGEGGPRLVEVGRDEADGFVERLGPPLRIAPLVPPPGLRRLRLGSQHR